MIETSSKECQEFVVWIPLIKYIIERLCSMLGHGRPKAFLPTHAGNVGWSVLMGLYVDSISTENSIWQGFSGQQMGSAYRKFCKKVKSIS